MREPQYRSIIEALDHGRRALARARLTAGLLRFLGVALATLAGLVLWAMLQRTLRMYSVPVATVASVLGAGIAVFALVRWVVVPLVRLPNRDDFVKLLERRFPKEKNLIVNAYQLGDRDRQTQAGQAPDLVEALVTRASERVSGLDLKHWRDPAPDRPYLWAGASAVAVIGALALVSPGLLSGALGQVLRPSLAQPPAVSLAVLPGNVEVNRGDDVAVQVQVTGTDRAPVLEFRERNGAWRTREFEVLPEAPLTRDGGGWSALLTAVDRNLEYRVIAPRAQSETFAISVMEAPRLMGFRAHLDYPDYTGQPNETLDMGTGDLAALKGTYADLRVLTNRPMHSAVLQWRADTETEQTEIPLTRVDETTWSAPFRIMDPASYAVVLRDESGADRVHSPRFRVEPVADRPPLLALHFPQEDHDLYADLMERVVADAADDYGFSSMALVYRIDSGPEDRKPLDPFTAGQTEFRLDTLWDMNGMDLLPGSEITYYLEVKDNDTVSGPKAARSPVRRVKFPTVAEMYEEVAEDHTREMQGLDDIKNEQAELRKKLEQMNNELKQGKDMDWELRQEMEQSLSRQQALEQQVSDAAQRLQETMEKASDRANMSQDLVQKMSEVNDLLNNLSNQDLKRSFQELSKALERMDKDSVRRALEQMQMSQDQMLRGLDRTIELLKQVRREEQVADVVRRTEEIADLQAKISEELSEAAEAAEPTESQDADSQSEATEGADPTESREAETAEGEAQNSPEGEQSSEGDPSSEELEHAELSPELQAELEQVAKEIAEELAKQQKQNEANNQAQSQNSEQSPQNQQQSGEQQQQSGEQQQAQNQEQQSQESQQSQNQEQQSGEQQQGSQNQESQQSQQQQSQKKNETPEQKMERLAKEQEQAEQLLEELKRQLDMLRKLNQDQQELAQNMDEMSQSETTKQLQQNMQGAQQQMQQGGSPQEAAKYAFEARQQAEQLAQMAQNMQSQMQGDQMAKAVEMIERIIRGLISVSGEQQGVLNSREDARDLAKKQFDLVELTEAVSESLQALAKESFAIQSEQQDQLALALDQMSRATRLYEEGNRRLADHQGRESAAELNQTIVKLMESQAQMCQGSGGGDGSQQMMQQMQGLSQAQQQLNNSTREMLERMAGQQRLSRTEEQRLAQMAAQQEMIRQGLQEMMEQFEETKDLLGDMKALQDDMQGVEELLNQKQLNRPLVERQQEILSRLLDAQRSVRQRDMDPTRESKTGTLAQRRSPPPLPDALLERQRTLEEDVLRGADDRYPAQYRSLVEEYFRALARETQSP